MTLILLAGVLLLAYSNGANDNFKGVATLFGSGATSYRTALAWATATTLAGSLLALLLAHGLVDTFKGKGLVPDAVTTDPSFLLAVSLGAALTVLLATWTGLPVSTTHALTGGLVGAGLLATKGQIHYAALLSSFLLPLLSGPVIAIFLTLVVYPLFRFVRCSLAMTYRSCVCVSMPCETVSIQANGALTAARTDPALQTRQLADCAGRYRGQVLGVEAGRILDGLHFLSAGAVGFARGLNDAPKIVALLLAVQVMPPQVGLALVAFIMAVGGVLNARQVAETMSRKITQMSPGQGLTANLISALLVGSASRLGLPMSTTHVSVGALFGIGVVTGTARGKVVLTIFAAWLTTLPLGSFFAAALYWLLGNGA